MENNVNVEILEEQKTDPDQKSVKKSGLKALFEESDNEKLKKKNPKKNTGKSGPTKPQFDSNGVKTAEATQAYQGNDGKTKYKEFYIDVTGTAKPGTQNFTQNLTNTSTQFKGLFNFGNDCYFNVAMQCLINCNDFHNLIDTANVKIEDDVTSFPIISNLYDFIMAYKSNNKKSALHKMTQILNIFDKAREQNDVHEFLIFLLDKLNEEANKAVKMNKTTLATNSSVAVKAKKADDEEGDWEEVKKGNKTVKQNNTSSSFTGSVICDIFKGMLKHELKTLGRQTTTTSNVEPFYVVSLDIDNQTDTLQKCLTKYFAKRKIENNNSSVTQYQQTFFDKIPKILIIHFKSIYYDPVTKKILKMNKLISYDENLLLSDEYLSSSTSGVNKNKSYELKSVITHKGSKASEGHYICFCKDEKKFWWLIDDSRIFRTDMGKMSSYVPYILFYQSS